MKKITIAILAGFGFGIGLAIVVFGIEYFDLNGSSRYDEPEKVSNPKDVRVVGHRPVTITEKYTISGELEFDDRDKYLAVIVDVKVFENGNFIVQCNDRIFTEYPSDQFSAQCGIKSKELPSGITYEVTVSQAELAKE